MYNNISIDKNSKFFVALCKYDNSVHSFMTLGVETTNGKVLLGAYGKVAGDEANACGFLFWETTARIINERIFFTETKKPIKQSVSYKAYSIDYNQYIEFLHYLKRISLNQNKRHSSLEAYCPIDDNENSTTVNLKWGSLNTLIDSNIEALPEEDRCGLQHIGKRNNCRHTAINMTKKAGNFEDLGKGISSLFTISPPLKTIIRGGVMGADRKHLYILPLPPKSFPGIDKNKLQIISKLYQRLDEIILSEQYNPVTANKFEKIKSLYVSITSKEKASLVEVFKEMHEWVDDNKSLIATHRKPHWISFQTATEKMFNNLFESENKFSINCKSKPPSYVIQQEMEDLQLTNFDLI